MHPRFNELINYASETYDLVIVDTPPVLAVTDPTIIASHAGTTLLVARYGVTHKKELEITQQRFEQNGVSIQGVVFNAIQRNGRKSYGHYGYYNYTYE
jgi:tyrosine-protein kinase Etk/Wzc